jgi:hypothetical protein
VSWRDRLAEQRITVRGSPSRLPVEADIARTEARLKVALPTSYRTFCTEIGPGRFGDLLEVWVPWHVKGFFESPRDIRARLTSLMDATGGGRQSLSEKAIQLGYVMLGAPPSPRVISGRCADLFFLPSEPTGGDEWAIYALDRRGTSGGAAPRLVKIARSFTSLLVEGFAAKRLARLPFVSAPRDDQFALEFYPRELPAP